MKKLFLLGSLLFAPARADFGLVTWNLKHLGREKQNLDDVALLIAGRTPEGRFVAGTFQKGPDFIMLQEVNPANDKEDTKQANGEQAKRTSTQAVRHIQSWLMEHLKERYCAGFSQSFKDRDYDTHERYAMLWKLSTIHYLTTQGEELKDCPPNTSVTLPTAEHPDLVKKMDRPPAIGHFLEVASGKSFLAATAHLIPNEKARGKDPRDEVPYLFLNVMTYGTKSFDGSNFPKIIAGDMNLNSGAPVYREWLDDKAPIEFRLPQKFPRLLNQPSFKAALPSTQKTSLQSRKRELSAAYDNVFIQRLSVVGEATVPNPYEVFQARTIKEIYNEISDHAPVFVKLRIEDSK